MTRGVILFAILVALALVVAYVYAAQKAQKGKTRETYADGDMVSVSCVGPVAVDRATYGPQASTSNCPTVDVTKTAQKLWEASQPFTVGAATLGGSCPDPRQLSVEYSCKSNNGTSLTYGQSSFRAHRTPRGPKIDDGQVMAEDTSAQALAGQLSWPSKKVHSRRSGWAVRI